MSTAKERYHDAHNNHEAMVAAFDWLRADLAQTYIWDPNDPGKADRVRRKVTTTILAAIDELWRFQ